MENRFTLIDEPWIPVADVGLVSLKDIFSRTDLYTLGGTPLQKIALMKLLLAIAQAAHSPENTREWVQGGVQAMAQASLRYLEQWYDRFWLYGEKPFLQMPAVHKAKLQSYGALMPEIASGNTTVLTQISRAKPLSDAEKALLLLVNMSCCFSGKKTDKNIVLSPGVEKKSAKAGPALCSLGLLHSFLTGENIMHSLWLNMLTQDMFGEKSIYPTLGTAPWESMPQGENCPVAQALRHSLMGRLVPLARFCLLHEEGVHFVEGIQHPDYLQGVVDPSVSEDRSATKPKMLWADPEKRPWRELTALLSFLQAEGKQKVHCLHISEGIPRLTETKVTHFGIWCGGIRLSSNAGEQYLSGMDDSVQSELHFETQYVSTPWYMALKDAMQRLEGVSKVLYGAVLGYYKALKVAQAEDYAKKATSLFWQAAEQSFSALSIACYPENQAQRHSVVKSIAAKAHTAYAALCPQGTARQLQAWVEHRPKLGKILATKS
ncbi:MAG: type I-E CRISPR-associated protein Cse1/CasA [Desulfovibrionaceae bacterium]|nr:type I-E CRISPR-associated protein Cse1/CasA [Desulfovibrionaceae bacterium]